MPGLTAKERDALLNAGRTIYAYKLMQAMGYQRLTKKVTEERTRQLLSEIGINELAEAKSWSQKIDRLADEDKKSSRATSLNQRDRLTGLDTGTMVPLLQ